MTDSVTLAQPKRIASFSLDPTTSWQALRLEGPGDFTFQNTSVAVLFWAQGRDEATAPGFTGFQMPAGAEPLNIPVSAEYPVFWYKAASAVTGIPGQLHF